MNSNQRTIAGKKGKKGIAPAICLYNPKFLHNIGSAIRAASCFGIKQVFYSGDRIQIDPRERIPREERMKGYGEVQLIQLDYFLEQFENASPVAIELVPGTQLLTSFDHPENAIYVFGPEDGSIPGSVLRHCHHFVSIPVRHCTNLSAAVYITLYDRLAKRIAEGKDIIYSMDDILAEKRGWGEEEF